MEQAWPASRQMPRPTGTPRTKAVRATWLNPSSIVTLNPSMLAFLSGKPRSGSPVGWFNLGMPHREIRWGCEHCAAATYFLSASLALPMAFRVLPLAWSILPSDCILVSPVMSPAACFILPPVRAAAPFTRSLSIAIAPAWEN